MRSQAKASSSPAARQSPWTAATVGHGNSSRSAIVRRWLVIRSRAWAEDLAFSPNHQGSERGLLCRRHGASQVFDELLAEQVQGWIRQREYPESARGLETHLFIHHGLHSGTIDIGIIMAAPQT